MAKIAPYSEPRPSARARSRVGDLVFRGITFGAALLVLIIVMLALQQLLQGSGKVLQDQGSYFFTGRDWDIGEARYGALSLIWGTFATSLIALLVGGVTGVVIAAFLVELAPKWLYKPVSFLVDLLAAIPSIIYGLWGVEQLVPWLRTQLYPQLYDTLGWTGLFGSPQSTGFGLLTAGFVLGIMIIPTVAAVTREMLLVVPKSMRDGALAMGATRTEALKSVQIPYAIGGILGGLILGLGRALGETMAVTMLIGNNANISLDLFKPAATLSSMIATNFGEADADFKAALIGLGFILFLLTMVINMVARMLVQRVRRKSGVS